MSSGERDTIALQYHCTHMTQLCNLFADSTTNCMLKTIEASTAATPTVIWLFQLCQLLLSITYIPLVLLLPCRLLQHRADMACGMDFDRPKIDGLPHPVRQVLK